MTWEGLSPPYATIVADPPWPLVWHGQAGGVRNGKPRALYNTDGSCSMCDGTATCPMCAGLGCDACDDKGDCPQCDGWA